MVFILIGIFLLLGVTRSKKVLFFCIFLIPYEGICLKGIGISAYCIISYCLGYFCSKFMIGESFLKRIYYKKYISLISISIFVSLVGFLVIGTYSDLYVTDGSKFIYNPSFHDLLWPLIRYMLSITSGICLYIIICNETRSERDISSSLFAFILSLSYLFVTWIGSFVYNLNLPSFLKMRYSGGGHSFNDLNRFSGYVGEYGLQAEYFILVIVFSLVLVFASKIHLSVKLIPVGAIILAIPMGVSTGTRAFVVILLVFLVLAISFLVFTRAISFGNIICILIAGILISSFVFYKMRGSLLEKRLAQTEEIASSKVTKSEKGMIGKIEKMLNRKYFTAFNDIVKSAGFLGVGPLSIPGVGGIAFCWHSLYYDIYIKFGIIGLFIYLCFYCKLLIDLLKRILEKKSISLHAIFLFALFFSLLLGEYARSYQNQASFMLMYWFLFGIIACANNMTNDLLYKKIP